MDDLVAADLAELQERWKASLPAKLEEARKEWERSRHTNIALLWATRNMVQGVLPPPSWLVSALAENSLQQMRPTLWKKAEKRWLLLQHLHFDLGLTFREAREGAANELGGSPETMRAGYKEYEKYLREKSPEQCATATAREASRPHPGLVEVDIGYCHARRTDLPWLLKRCPGLVEFGRCHGFVRLAVDNSGDRFPEAGATLRLIRQCPGLVEVGCCDGLVKFERERA